MSYLHSHVIVENFKDTFFKTVIKVYVYSLQKCPVSKISFFDMYIETVIITSLCTQLHYTYLHFSCHCDEIYTNLGMKSATTSIELLSLSDMSLNQAQYI